VNDVNSSAFEELSVERLYEILRLRVEVFVVEQQCAYSEIDALDSEALHLWIDDHDGLTTNGPWVLSAQSYLCDWYIQLGFVPSGPEFDEDGIPHIPMRRAAA